MLKSFAESGCVECQLIFKAVSYFFDERIRESLPLNSHWFISKGVRELEFHLCREKSLNKSVDSFHFYAVPGRCDLCNFMESQLKQATRAICALE
jgi:hypothetical protein